MSKRVKLSVFGGVVLVLAAIGGLTPRSGQQAVEVRTRPFRLATRCVGHGGGQVRPQNQSTDPISPADRQLA